jgi:hypothetical protein
MTSIFPPTLVPLVPPNIQDDSYEYHEPKKKDQDQLGFPLPDLFKTFSETAPVHLHSKLHPQEKKGTLSVVVPIRAKKMRLHSEPPVIATLNHIALSI